MTADFLYDKNVKLKRKKPRSSGSQSVFVRLNFKQKIIDLFFFLNFCCHISKLAVKEGLNTYILTFYSVCRNKVLYIRLDRKEGCLFNII